MEGQKVVMLRQKWHAVFLSRMRYPGKPWTPAEQKVLDAVVTVLSAEEQAIIEGHSRPSTTMDPDNMAAFKSMTGMRTKSSSSSHSDYPYGIEAVVDPSYQLHNHHSVPDFGKPPTRSEGGPGLTSSLRSKAGAHSRLGQAPMKHSYSFSGRGHRGNDANSFGGGYPGNEAAVIFENPDQLYGDGPTNAAMTGPSDHSPLSPGSKVPGSSWLNDLSLLSEGLPGTEPVPGGDAEDGVPTYGAPPSAGSMNGAHFGLLGLLRDSGDDDSTPSLHSVDRLSLREPGDVRSLPPSASSRSFTRGPKSSKRNEDGAYQPNASNPGKGRQFLNGGDEQSVSPIPPPPEFGRFLLPGQTASLNTSHQHHHHYHHPISNYQHHGNNHNNNNNHIDDGHSGGSGPSLMCRSNTMPGGFLFGMDALDAMTMPWQHEMGLHQGGPHHHGMFGGPGGPPHLGDSFNGYPGPPVQYNRQGFPIGGTGRRPDMGMGFHGPPPRFGDRRFM